jgi:hypothetical protein
MRNTGERVSESRRSGVVMGYADPPYPGQAKRLYGDHPDYAGEVDHAELIPDLLARFPDGWALSTSVRALPAVLRLCPDRALVCCWLKRATSPPMGDHRMYSWEPVILCDTPNPVVPTRMHCEANTAQYTFRAKGVEYVVGAKPQAFSFWLFAAMGLRPDDEFVDLFPGSGAVTEAWNAWRAQGQLVA